ncbi:MAG: hypothetical protein ACHQEM_08565 [Chitinophagales bacterium]
MKLKLDLQRLIMFFTAIFLVYACKKSIQTDSTTLPTSNRQLNTDSGQANSNSINEDPPYPTVSNYHCPGPDYGDSIIYAQPVSGLQDYIVKPLNNPGSGRYFSWPQGLMLNTATGAIDVTQSASGQRYSLGFVKDGTSDTCMQTLIIGGAAYTDSVYVLSKNQNTAIPYFDANPNNVSVCPSGSGTSGGPVCNWDLNGLAKLQNIRIDNHTGIIDLAKTLSDGAFGIIPLNGTTIQVDIYYTLVDNSNQAMQHTPVKLIYYDHKSSIPQSLLDQINSKRTNILDQVLILLGGNPKPPLIIITRDEN